MLETLENPEWVCPGCRGICNCSLCRKRKGWLPTGTAYKKVKTTLVYYSPNVTGFDVFFIRYVS